MEDRFIVGVNYWPREKAMAWWREFDASTVARDFSLLSEYQFDVVRVFLLWEDFQPGERQISVPSLDHLVQVAETAHECRLQILPTFFTGHMRGINWLPAWMLGGGEGDGRFPVFCQGGVHKAGIRNFYAQRDIWNAQKLLIREVTNALQGHPVIWGWDLGNEPSNIVRPPSKDLARAWMEEMVTEVKRRDEDLPVTLGLYQEDLEEDRTLGPKEVTEYCDVLSIHAYPCYAKWADGAADEKAPLFLALITGWLGGTGAVLLEEFGVATNPEKGILPYEDREKLGDIPLISEEQAGDYYRRVLELFIRNGFPGAFAWCFSDYEPALWDDFPLSDRVHERYFGLFRWNGSAKDAVRLILPVDRRREEKEPRWDWIDIKPEEYYQHPLEHLERLYRNFKDRFDEF
jgi:endo-1,4-beta-mannosidase